MKENLQIRKTHQLVIVSLLLIQISLTKAQSFQDQRELNAIVMSSNFLEIKQDIGLQSQYSEVELVRSQDSIRILDDDGPDGPPIAVMVIPPLFFGTFFLIILTICWASACCKYQFINGFRSTVCRRNKCCKKKMPRYVKQHSEFQKAQQRGVVGPPDMNIMRMVASSVPIMNGLNPAQIGIGVAPQNMAINGQMNMMYPQQMMMGPPGMNIGSMPAGSAPSLLDYQAAQMRQDQADHMRHNMHAQHQMHGQPHFGVNHHVQQPISQFNSMQPQIHTAHISAGMGHHMNSNPTHMMNTQLQASKNTHQHKNRDNHPDGNDDYDPTAGFDDVQINNIQQNEVYE
ncbi:UNKNOWN [Stylonychia lemnae]|uniref:Uncharacterized protein n=1 Tax=Stylonychia lemnae TaxID=5949 RepID=A0A078AT13_STYLE|nr:UNKNOWN [Stylonychia lemnae]|eukprot:CDW84337.1 UNKNOWN [Stylonychia lemnae]